MARHYVYCYDEKGRFTESIAVEEKPIYERQKFTREEKQTIYTPEKRCDVHGIDDMEKFECPNCVMESERYEMVTVEYEDDIIVGFEPDVPPNATLEPCIFTDATWDGTKWIYDRDLLPPEPEPIPEPTPMEKLRTELDATQEALAELILEKPASEVTFP